MPQHLNSRIGNLAAIWGVLGTCAILCYAIWRMFGHVQEGFRLPMGIEHYALLVPWLLFMVYSEGYKGFQKSFSPRVAARANYLRDHATWIRVIFAPPFCMGFFDSTRKRKIVLWILLIMVTSFVVLFQYIPQPWRGVLDLGVVLGLSWGLIATLVLFFKYWLSGSGADPEIPTKV